MATNILLVLEMPSKKQGVNQAEPLCDYVLWPLPLEIGLAFP